MTDRQKARRRRLQARIAALTRASTPGYDGAEATRKATSAFWDRLDHEVDPESKLDPADRRERAKKLWQARMCQAKLEKLKRSRRKAA